MKRQHGHNTEVTEKIKPSQRPIARHNLEQLLVVVPLQEYYNALEFSPVAITTSAGIKVVSFLQ